MGVRCFGVGVFCSPFRLRAVVEWVKQTLVCDRGQCCGTDRRTWVICMRWLQWSVKVFIFVGFTLFACVFGGLYFTIRIGFCVFVSFFNLGWGDVLALRFGAAGQMLARLDVTFGIFSFSASVRVFFTFSCSSSFKI